MVLYDPLMRENVHPTSVTRARRGGQIVLPLMRADQTFKGPVRGSHRHKGPPLGPERWKHPTKATKLELLRYCAFMVATDIWSVVNRFNMSYQGAEVKLWRLTKQGVLEAKRECDGTKTWWLTPAGRRSLQYLEENAEQYGGGTKGMIIGRLQAETKQLRKQIAEANGIVNKNVALEQALAHARKEIQRLKAQNTLLVLKTLGQRPTG